MYSKVIVFTVIVLVVVVAVVDDKYDVNSLS